MNYSFISMEEQAVRDLIAEQIEAKFFTDYSDIETQILIDRIVGFIRRGGE